MTESLSVHKIADELYTYLASRFPVCCASDEFVYFPQAVTSDPDWHVWDDFSPDSVGDAILTLRQARERLDGSSGGAEGGSPDREGLSSLLCWMTRNLEEQFTHVKTHSTQPTFILTVATVGLVHSLSSGDQEAFGKRVSTLPAFLAAASSSLSAMPELYRDLGIKMARQLAGWLGSLEQSSITGRAIESVSGFAGKLAEVPVREDFRLPADLFDHVVKVHTGSGLSIRETLAVLKEETARTEDLLRRESGKLGYGSDWETAFASIPSDKMPAGGKEELLRTEIERLRLHCQDQGFLDPGASNAGDLVIEELPPSLRSVRAADSYNALPGHPFRGGTFYIFTGGSLGGEREKVHPVYRMTAAHEAYPGHHLLDRFRWENPLPALRPIEYPLFYEGWACFGEDLMFETGAFDRSCDNLIRLRRRFRHSVRGEVDLCLHSGEFNLDRAAERLKTAGFNEDRAVRTARKYALRPAYQMCYTIGRRRFQRLFDSHGKKSAGKFVNTVLSCGELLFEDLERVLEQTFRTGAREKRSNQS